MRWIPDDTPWYWSDYADHLIPTCPGLRKTNPNAERGGGGLGDIEDVTVCGWCRRVWLARHPLERAEASG